MKDDCQHFVLSKELNERLFLQRVPLSGGIELTNKCNFKCIHCYETIERDGCGVALSSERLLQIIDELVDMGLISVFFTGGEAMLRPDFNYIYEYVRKKGVMVAILSNGTTITEEKCKLFIKYAPRMIDISIYGANETTYQKVTGKSGMFEKLIEGLNLLQKYDIPFQLKTVVLTENRHEINEMRKIAKQYGVPFKFFTNVRPYNDGDKTPIEYMLSNEEIIELEKNDEELINYYNNKRGKMIARELSERQKQNCTYLCRIAKNSFFISYDGILNGCVRSRRNGFDLKVDNVAKGWEYLFEKFVEPKKEQDFPCSKCKIIEYCDFCPGEFEMSTGNPTVAPIEICDLAHTRYKEFGK